MSRYREKPDVSTAERFVAAGAEHYLWNSGMFVFRAATLLERPESGCSGTLLVSDDPEHLVAAMGCEDLIIVHTGRSTLACRKDRAEDVKKLQSLVAERYGEGYL